MSGLARVKYDSAGECPHCGNVYSVAHAVHTSAQSGRDALASVVTEAAADVQGYDTSRPNLRNERSGVLTSAALISRLRSLRQIKGMSAQDVADATGIPRSVIANMETGRRESISVDEAAAICGALGVDLRVVLSSEPMPVAREVWVV